MALQTSIPEAGELEKESPKEVVSNGDTTKMIQESASNRSRYATLECALLAEGMIEISSNVAEL